MTAVTVRMRSGRTTAVLRASALPRDPPTTCAELQPRPSITAMPSSTMSRAVYRGSFAFLGRAQLDFGCVGRDSADDRVGARTLEAGVLVWIRARRHGGKAEQEQGLLMASREVQ